MPTRGLVILLIAALTALNCGSSTPSSPTQPANVTVVGGRTASSGLSGSDVPISAANPACPNARDNLNCTFNFSLQNTGTGCASGIRGVVNVYSNLLSSSLSLFSSQNFVVSNTTRPNETVAVTVTGLNLPFCSSGCTLEITAAPSWTDTSCS
jgi:hypothetical protein